MVEIKNKEELTEQLNNKIVVLDFNASWCGPCKMLGKIIDELEKEYENKEIQFVSCNVDEADEDFLSDYQIMNIPRIFFFKNQEQVGSHIGLLPKDLFEQKLNELI